MLLKTLLQAHESRGRISSLEVNSESVIDLHARFVIGSTGQITLRILEPNQDDHHLETGFYDSLSRESQNFFGPPEEFTPPWSEEEYDLRFGQSLKYAFILPGDGVERIIGKFYLKRIGQMYEGDSNAGKTAELGIGISDQYHRRGLGSMGIDILEWAGGQISLDSIWLMHFEENDKGAGLYEHRGYSIVRKYKLLNPFTNTEMTAVERIKHL